MGGVVSRPEAKFAITFVVRTMDGGRAKKTVEATGEIPPIATARARRSLEERGIEIVSPLVTWVVVAG